MEKIEKRLEDIEMMLENTYKILTEHNKIFESISEKFDTQEKMIVDSLNVTKRMGESIAITQNSLLSSLNQNQKDISEIYGSLNNIYDLLNISK